MWEVEKLDEEMVKQMRNTEESLYAISERLEEMVEEVEVIYDTADELMVVLMDEVNRARDMSESLGSTLDEVEEREG